MKQFKIVLEGLPGSGKSKFINDLMRIHDQRMGWQERYIFEQTEAHEITVTLKVIPVPKRVIPCTLCHGTGIMPESLDIEEYYKDEE